MKIFRILPLTLMLGLSSFEASASSFVTRACGALLSTITTPIARRIEARLTDGDRLRRRLARDPDASVDLLDGPTLEAMNEAQARALTTLAYGSKLEVLGIAVRHPLIWPDLWHRWGGAQKVRTAYVTFAMSLFGVGLAQPYVLPPQPVTEDVDLKADEFEIVFAALHTYLRIGTREYDYMFFVANRDDVEHYHHQTVTKVRLRLTVAEVENLRAFMESEVGSVGFYYLYTFTGSNCLSNINRAINKSTGLYVPDGIKTSPTLTLAFFKASRALGDTRVEAIEQKFGEENPLRPRPLISAFDAFLAAYYFPGIVITSAVDHLPYGWTVYRPQR